MVVPDVGMMTKFAASVVVAEVFAWLLTGITLYRLHPAISRESAAIDWLCCCARSRRARRAADLQRRPGSETEGHDIVGMSQPNRLCELAHSPSPRCAEPGVSRDEEEADAVDATGDDSNVSDDDASAEVRS